jgi:ParB/RepB/Spo0J family partition protein
MDDRVVDIFIDRIDDPQSAMRSEIKDQSLFELADNIRANGLINPITVRPVHADLECPLHNSENVNDTCRKPEHWRYEVVAGHRRFSACKINGMIKLQCIVRVLNDKETFAVMAAENLERKDVDLVDEAAFIRQYMEQTQSDVKETAKSLRRSVGYVETRLAVGLMPEYMKDLLRRGELKLGAALAFNQIENEAIRKSWTERAAEQGISIATAEYQLIDYRTNKLLYDGIVADNAEAANDIAPKAVMLRCSLTGQMVDARLIKSVLISETHLESYFEFARLYQIDLAKTESLPVESALKASPLGEPSPEASR